MSNERFTVEDWQELSTESMKFLGDQEFTPEVRGKLMQFITKAYTGGMDVGFTEGYKMGYNVAKPKLERITLIVRKWFQKTNREGMGFLETNIVNCINDLKEM